MTSVLYFHTKSGPIKNKPPLLLFLLFKLSLSTNGFTTISSDRFDIQNHRLLIVYILTAIPQLLKNLLAFKAIFSNDELGFRSCKFSHANLLSWLSIIFT